MTLTGIILAGGQSSRMGRDKALLPIGQHTLVELVIQRLQPHVEQVFVIGHAQNAGTLHRLLCEERLVVSGILTDLKPGCGPLMGLYTGLMQTETPLSLCVPCDMPWVEGRLIERLASACRGEIGVVASLHPREGLQPFPLICHAKACRAIGALLDDGERSLQSLLRQPQARLVRIEEPELWRSFTNVNTLADYAKLCDDPLPLRR